ncbi:hypothetical protein MMC25_008035 [Agyrium rufum]|nr:hypothetical protein [Agyrium rufum]
MNEVKRKMEEGTAIPCSATYGLAKQTELEFEDIELAYALSAPWAAGIGTTTTAFEIAILAMLHFPDCVQKAQVEIESIVGQARMPNFEDQQSLPYLGAFIRETLRWRLVTPTGIGHSSTQDYHYKGMLIPKDTSVYANASAIMLDPKVFPEVIIDGKPYIPDANDFTTGLVSYPANLKYQLIPRNEERKSLIIADANLAQAEMAYLEGSPVV